jgi:hypothetical protein
VHAEEQHGGPAVAAVAFDLGEGVEALAGEALGEEGEEGGDGGFAGELVEAGLEEQLDGLGAEPAVELGAEAPGSGAQGGANVEGLVGGGRGVS